MMYEFAVTTQNPISRHWVHGEVTRRLDRAEKQFNSLKTRKIPCRLIRRQIMDWELVRESEVKEMSEMDRLVGEMANMGWCYSWTAHGRIFFEDDENDRDKKFRSWDEVAKFVEENK